MTVHQHAVSIGEFARYLRDVTALLDPGRGWYGVFCRRDPDGMGACLAGAEIPPWDVMESLFTDLASVRGAAFAERESVRAAELYGACAVAHDRRPGGRQQLLERLELMLREQANAARRLSALRADAEAGATDAEGAAAWAQDDHARASARCAELRGRLAAVAVPNGRPRTEGEPGPAPGPRGAPAPAGRTAPGPAWAAAPAGRPAPGPTPAPGLTPVHGRAPEHGAAPSGAAAQERAAEPEQPEAAWRAAARERAATPETAIVPEYPAVQEPAAARHPAAPAPAAYQPPDPAPAPAPARKPPRSKPRGARFAGLEAEDETAVAAAPALPMAAVLPRGARFGGAPGVGDGSPGARAAAPDPVALHAARAIVATLVRLRAEGRSGEAHGVLCEAAGRPAELLPVLAVELHRAGLGADWSTLLWEVSSLSPGELAGAADALAAAGRPEDCEQLLRQGVARPAAEIADAVVALDRAGRGPQALALLGAFVRVRTPQDAARIAEGDPHHVVPQLLAAARTVSEARERDVEHALRVAGIG
ncbi:hypothetical protein [Streptomyces sp. NPDC059651]|uniref:hypothetical protein n=1 Tax=Streptomyces sp. NPDC059651 TaxID=3346897 RepID=UPI0036B1B5A8